MGSDTPLLVQMLLPVGRCRRRGLLLAAATLLVAQLAFTVLVAAGLVGFYGAGALVFKLLMVWIALAMTVKRLHDVGQSAWWMVAGVTALLAWTFAISLAFHALVGIEAFIPGTLSYWLSFAIVVLPALAVAIWLHAAPGDHRDNRYGPLPDGFGLSMPERASRRRSETAAA